jgi:nanoRNase/pAp phosphatase (c-di-AMP/oligoRNAs hydrolase)
MNGNRSDEQIREFRKQQVRSEYEELANRARKKLEEFNELVNAEQQETVVDDEKRREKLRKLQMVPNNEGHPLVQEIAQELNMDPQQALKEADEL